MNPTIIYILINSFSSNSLLESKQAEAFSCENRKILFRCPVSCLLRISWEGKESFKFTICNFYFANILCMQLNCVALFTKFEMFFQILWILTQKVAEHEGSSPRMQQWMKLQLQIFSVDRVFIFDAGPFGPLFLIFI